MNGDNPGQFHGKGPQEPFQGLKEKLDLEYEPRELTLPPPHDKINFSQ